MLDYLYLNKLNIFLKNKIHIFITDPEMVKIVDNEINYILKKKGSAYFLFIEERGSISIRSEYKNENDMKRGLAFFLKNAFGRQIDYSKPNNFEKITNICDLKKVMLNSCCDDNAYSVECPQADSINICEAEEKTFYEIYYLDTKMNKHMIERDNKIPYIFERFYNEVIYFITKKKMIEEYENVFGDKLLDQHKFDLLGY